MLYFLELLLESSRKIIPGNNGRWYVVDSYAKTVVELPSEKKFFSYWILATILANTEALGIPNMHALVPLYHCHIPHETELTAQSPSRSHLCIL